MHFAAITGQAPHILELLRRNASLSSKTKSLQRSPIFEAVLTDNFTTFEVLADHQPNYFKEKDIQGWTLLHVAASRGCKEIIARLLGDGADIHALTDARTTMDVPKRLLGRSIAPLDVARVWGSKRFKAFLEVLKEWDEELRVIWEGCECDIGCWNDVDVCEKCYECDVFFPSVSF